MAKAVLVMDMPVVCVDCPCHFANLDGTVKCGVCGMQLLTDDIEEFRHDECPLLSLSEIFENILKRLYEAKHSVPVRSRNSCEISAAQGKVYAYEDAIRIVDGAMEELTDE